MSEKPPEFCDYDCPFADFPPAETVGICRTMAAVWCRRLKQLVNKNAACEYGARSAPAPRPRRGGNPGHRRRENG